MSVSPGYVGGYGKPWTISLDTDSGHDKITGVVASSISVIVRNMDTKPQPTDSESTGVITIVTSDPAVISWQPTAEDYGTAGDFQIIPVVNFSTGPSPYDPILLTLKGK